MKAKIGFQLNVQIETAIVSWRVTGEIEAPVVDASIDLINLRLACNPELMSIREEEASFYSIQWLEFSLHRS